MNRLILRVTIDEVDDDTAIKVKKAVDKAVSKYEGARTELTLYPVLPSLIPSPTPKE